MKKKSIEIRRNINNINKYNSVYSHSVFGNRKWESGNENPIVVVVVVEYKKRNNPWGPGYK